MSTFKLQVKDSGTLCVVGGIPEGLQGAQKLRLTRGSESKEFNVKGQNPHMIWFNEGADYHSFAAGATKANPIEVEAERLDE